ncbi:MAG: hypothetical protein NBV68_18650 [Erythrobacter sp.]|uniref:hypothetical protein n=1 Tax=Erythrobacter sp. TaxID=1042 RepID=UPI0025F050F3|nr:hypothetical protein [Erythrobacter sp.]MCM0001396.1 hypothetical protein [Erythrobacter sp.]
MRRLNRAEQRERKQLEDAFLAAFKTEARAREWKFLKPTAFAVVSTWFVMVDPAIHRDEERASLTVKIKPRTIDDLMARVAYGRPLGKHPLSTLARGPLFLTLPIIDEPMDSTCGVGPMLEQACSMLDRARVFAEQFTLDDFFEAETLGRRDGQVRYNAILALLLKKDYDLAHRLLDHADNGAGLSASVLITSQQIRDWMAANP